MFLVAGIASELRLSLAPAQILRATAIASDSSSEGLDHSSGHVVGRYNAMYELRFRPTQCLSP
jgi:hypothetical protein